MKKYTVLLIATFFVSAVVAQEKKTNPAEEAAKTEIWEPVPKLVSPGVLPQDAPSDAIILFNGRNLDAWHSVNNPSNPAGWTIDDGFFTVKKGTGNIETNKKFLDYQLHLEWKIPSNIQGEGQARGNSGIFLASTGKGDNGYEIQILDVYKNKTYVNGQTGSVYKQAIPLANANKKPGEWQYYDIIWTAPRFHEDGSLKSPARVTVLLNGVLLQNNFELKGETKWIGEPSYKKHGSTSIKLQDHGDPSAAISFRNIWVREL
ncbi:3-keto-disaccharide hydrolase [Pedobacter sp. MW01-1-1]|uniref:3-keto-disaccharide hydrolase n=1 Tax=Pedobacter sp. MW01-1-1 TaxID=3383027 RepID=UPI003FF0816A